MTTKILTQEYLKELLSYNPLTGEFVWIAPRKRVIVGRVAGGLLKGYVRICINKKTYWAHRLAWLYMTGKSPSKQIDHINHNRADNRFINLRECSHQENHRNRTLQKNNTSGFIGVCWNKNDKKWLASIRINGNRKNLGLFKERNHAVIARWMAEDEYGYHQNHGSERCTY
jgi:hypothetical protein